MGNELRWRTEEELFGNEESSLETLGGWTVGKLRKQVPKAFRVLLDMSDSVEKVVLEVGGTELLGVDGLDKDGVALGRG